MSAPRVVQTTKTYVGWVPRSGYEIIRERTRRTPAPNRAHSGATRARGHSMIDHEPSVAGIEAARIKERLTRGFYGI